MKTLVTLVLGLFSSMAFSQVINPATDLPNFRVVVDNQVFRGGQPTPAGVRAMAAKGIKTIVNVRQEDPTIAQQEGQLAQSLGMKYFYEPMGSDSVPNDKQVGYIEQTLLSDPTLRPVFVHCHYGEDRTGVIIGLYRVFEQVPHWTPQQAYNEMLADGFHTALTNLQNYYFQKTNWHPLALSEVFDMGLAAE